MPSQRCHFSMTLYQLLPPLLFSLLFLFNSVSLSFSVSFLFNSALFIIPKGTLCCSQVNRIANDTQTQEGKKITQQWTKQQQQSILV